MSKSSEYRISKRLPLRRLATVRVRSPLEFDCQRKRVDGVKAVDEKVELTDSDRRDLAAAADKRQRKTLVRLLDDKRVAA